MNDYLGKEHNEATTKLFEILRKHVDIQKRMTFQFLHSNVNISKYGYQQERQLNGFLNLESEDFEDNTNLKIENSQENSDQELEAETESEEESDSEKEQMELNRILKEGRSGGKGIKLGEESREVNARMVISKEEDIRQFEIDDENTRFQGGGFQSFENQKPINVENSNDVNPLFRNQMKTEENSEFTNEAGNKQSGVFENNLKLNELDNGKSSQQENQKSNKNNELKTKLSFGNDSFNQNQSNVEGEKGNAFQQDKKVNVLIENVKIQSSFEMEPKKISREVDDLLSSKTLGERSPKTSNMYQERYFEN